jgi:uncharacterized protein UPF0164
MMLKLLSAFLLLAMGHQARAASGFAGEFLALGAGARALALGGAYVALADDATAGYWNPAGLVDVRQRQLHVMHAERFAGMVAHDCLALARAAQRGRGFGLSLLRLGVDDIPFTELEDPSRPLSAANRPLVVATETSSDYALYLSYGRRLRTRLSLGASVKGIYRTVGSYSAYGFGLDLGLRLRLHRAISVAAVVRDATSTPIVWNTNTTDSIHPSLLLGVACTAPLAAGQLTALIASRSGGNASDAGDQQPLSAGLEFAYAQIALRAGLDEGRQSFGVGLQPHARIQLDLAYAQHDELESIQQFSAAFRF